MGLLDTPLVCEMDAIEKKARKGDDKALREFVYSTLRPVKKIYVDRLMNRDGLSLRDALEAAGITICIR